jgi:hypothetical protein
MSNRTNRNKHRIAICRVRSRHYRADVCIKRAIEVMKGIRSALDEGWDELEALGVAVPPVSERVSV